jgi:murein DD-endopeptidase MepM/ murein hydrolase activator NlpD
VDADTDDMPDRPRRPRALRRPALRRPALLAAVVGLVALVSTACLPAADTVPAPAAPTAPPLSVSTGKATIVRCPVDGFTYGQGFGPTHSGIDLAAAEGTPVYAVRNGTLWYWSTGDVGGYSVYLKADDGNTYYYTHLSPYAATLENTTRSVNAGDVVESVNHTGNAAGFDHLHFEVRLGGPNGTRVDPRPTLDAAGCR